MTKITIIGSGNVGATIAYTLTVTGIAGEIVLIDINKEIKNSDMDSELAYKLRERIFYIARGVAIKLHNDHSRTSYSVKIAVALKLQFADISSLRDIATQDLVALSSHFSSNNSYTPSRTKQTSSSSPLGCLIVGIFILLLIIISAGTSTCGSNKSNNNTNPSYSSSSSSSNSSSSNSSSNSSSSSSSSSSTATSYTVTLNKQGGSGGTSTITVKYGAAMPSATAPTRSGYVFGGYYSSTNGSGTKYYDSNMRSVKTWNKSSGATLYAYWISDDKISLTSYNFEDYFTITTSAEYDGTKVVISYSIRPKSTAYASDSSSSSSITVKLRGGVYPYSFSTTPTYSKTESITLYKSSGYKKSGTITVYVSSGADEIYWVLLLC